ncbi:MAG: adenosylcobalamin-dependent ribonucleoside-diphosphate reductase [DPANN group archaeon]|nr:adenosylcobalamin-dependent ribonucleoside-diphosphate reductase [DPANN group archaeon]
MEKLVFNSGQDSIMLTENQHKVIRDKYLRDDLGPEIWLRRIAKNIALTEILYFQKTDRDRLFDGVSHNIKKINIGSGRPTELLLFHHGLNDHNERHRNMWRFLNNAHKLADTDMSITALVKYWEDKFYWLLSNFYFLPNSPTLMNAGRELQQLSACYVLPIEDSMEGWMDAAKNAAIIHQSGGGTGFAVSRIRPKGDPVKSTRGIASGPLSPLWIIDSVTQQVKQGGTRRGANMGIIFVYHPDVFDFVTMKREPGKLENFNISVAVDEKFMQSVEDDEEIELVNPRTKQVARRIKAKELFDLMCQCAWETGDPGYVVIDRINASSSNPTPVLGEIESTNPCGEQPLLPYEPCNLGSINLSKFVEAGEINYEFLGDVVKLATRFLDNVIDVNNYPIPEIELMAKGNRRIGLGVMGWAEMLVKLGVPYDSEQAVQLAEEMMKFINNTSLKASEDLAAERGVFSNFKDSIYDESGKYFRNSARPRNCARTTIAPTGTIAIAAGLQGAGIEPFFSIAYVRYNAKGLDALKDSRTPDDNDTFYEHNNLFGEVAKTNNYFGLEEKELWKKIAENHGSVRGISEIPENLQKVFASAHDISVEYHILHQAAFQRYTDNAVSKTINLPNSATVEDVRKAYWFAFKQGVKGLTIYRDGSKAFQVLSSSKQTEKPRQGTLAEEPVKIEGGRLKTVVRERPDEISGKTYKIKTGYGNLYVTINDDSDGRPFEIFATTGKTGGVLAAKSEAICRLASLSLRSGISPEIIIKQIEGIRGPMPTMSKYGIVFSIPDAIAKILKKHINAGQTNLEEFKEEKPAEVKTKRTVADTGEVPECPDCRNILEFGEGCATCQFCGYSKCS